jgi:hypothetical protein
MVDAQGSDAEVFRYATAYAFRAALKAQFTAIAKADGRYSVDELHRQFAYDRLLAHCFTGTDVDRWVLKGAGALLARLDGVARHSKDVDLYFAERAVAVEEAVGALAAAADRDLGDHFRFEITRTTPLQEAAKGRRLDVVAYLGARYAAFHVDVVVDTAMSGHPDWAPPLVRVDIEGLTRPRYRVFPVADHLADKLCAMLESHDTAVQGRVSTRVKDLVDIALIASTQIIDGRALRIAIVAGTTHRRLDLPAQFAVPDVAAWRSGYPKKAAEAPGVTPTFDEAVDLASRLLDPILTGAVTGSWDPAAAEWRS